MGKTAVAPQILDFLKQNANTPITVTEIEKALNLNKHQIQNAITNMRNGNWELGQHIVVVGRGNVWQWSTSPNGIKDKSLLFEQIATTTSGKLILQDNEGNAYLAQRIE